MDISRILAIIITVALHLPLLLIEHTEPDRPVQSDMPVLLARIAPPEPKSMQPKSTVLPDVNVLPDSQSVPEPVIIPEPVQPVSTEPFPTDRLAPVVDVRRDPVYPKKALINNWTGTVRLELTISPAGSISGITVLQSTGFPVLDTAFINAARQQTYLPQEFQGNAIESTLELAYTFSLD